MEIDSAANRLAPVELVRQRTGRAIAVVPANNGVGTNNRRGHFEQPQPHPNGEFTNQPDTEPAKEQHDQHLRREERVRLIQL